MPSSRRDDPYLNFNFLVEIDGETAAGFNEADLPEGRIEAVAYREGTDRTSAPRLLPGRVEYGRLVLRRGFVGDAALFQWWQSVAQGNLDRRNLSIICSTRNARRSPAGTSAGRGRRSSRLRLSELSGTRSRSRLSSSPTRASSSSKSALEARARSAAPDRLVVRK
jgi:phage tail-like protein